MRIIIVIYNVVVIGCGLSSLLLLLLLLLLLSCHMRRIAAGSFDAALIRKTHSLPRKTEAVANQEVESGTPKNEKVLTQGDNFLHFIVALRVPAWELIYTIPWHF